MGEKITALENDILSSSDVLLLSMSLELQSAPSLLYIISNKPETVSYSSVLIVAYCHRLGHGVPQVTKIICFISPDFWT
jgi:hypothetical protein